MSAWPSLELVSSNNEFENGRVHTAHAAQRERYAAQVSG